MTDQELNEAMALKLGWTRETWDDSSLPFKGLYWFKPGSQLPDSVPDYCHSIEAAWEIVPHLPYFTLKIVGYMSIKDGSDITKWVCASVDVSDLNNIVGYEAEADTAPRAICEAFLKLDRQVGV